MKPEDIIALAKRAESLKRLSRTGWAIAGLNAFRQESIAEHSYGTTLLALLFSRNIAQLGESVDIQKVITMAVLHDLPESEISDIPQSAVIVGGESMSKAKRIAEEKAAASILSSDSDLLKIWHEYNAQETIESRIVRGADTIDMLHHALALEETGAAPEMFNSFFQNSKTVVESLQIPIILDVYKDIEKEHKKRFDRT